MQHEFSFPAGVADVPEGAWDRESALTRYRQLRELSRKHGNAVRSFVSPRAVPHWGRRLGLARGNTLLLDTFAEFALILDLANYAAWPGKTSALERYRNAARLPAGSPEAVMLDAMCASRLSLFVVQRRHQAAGLILHDLPGQRDVWLMDEGLEASAPPGFALASRVVEPDDFIMTTGAAIPLGRVDPETMNGFRDRLLRDREPTGAPSLRFVEFVYQQAVAFSLLSSMRYE